MNAEQIHSAIKEKKNLLFESIIFDVTVFQEYSYREGFSYCIFCQFAI